MSTPTKRELVRLRGEIEAMSGPRHDAPERITTTYQGVTTELVRTDAYDASGAPLYQVLGRAQRYVVVGLGGPSIVLLPEVRDPAELSDLEDGSPVFVRGEGVTPAADGIAGLLAHGFDENGGAQ